MINIYTPNEIRLMAEGGKILQTILQKLKDLSTAGLTTLDLENAARELFKDYNVQSAFLGFKGYPANICLSLIHI